MALRVALPRSTESFRQPTDAIRIRRISLAAYLELDPAIRFVIALALVAGISLLYLMQTGNVADLNLQMQRLQAEHDQLIHHGQRLQLDIAAEQALPHIRQVATEQLHMVPVGNQVVYISVPAAPAASASLAVPAVAPGGDGTP